MQDIENIELVFLSIDDYDELKEAMIEAYSNLENAYWKLSHIKSLISKFSEGQVAIKVNGQFAGCALAIIVDYGKFENVSIGSSGELVWDDAVDLCSDALYMQLTEKNKR